jgi:hypothetical protein
MVVDAAGQCMASPSGGGGTTGGGGGTTGGGGGTTGGGGGTTGGGGGTSGGGEPPVGKVVQDVCNELHAIIDGLVAAAGPTPSIPWTCKLSANCFMVTCDLEMNVEYVCVYVVMLVLPPL